VQTPLNFVAAFFAIPSQSFPQSGSGNDQKVDWNAKKIVGGLGMYQLLVFGWRSGLAYKMK